MLQFTPMRTRLWSWRLALLCVFLAGCGGPATQSSNSGLFGPGSFTLSAAAANPVLPPGGSDSISLTVTPADLFNAPVQVNFGGLPPGVTVTPNPATVTVTQPQTVTLAVAPQAAAGPLTLTATGTSGSLSGSAQVQVSVLPFPSGTLSTRTRFVYTGAATQYFSSLNPNWAIYEAASNRLFMTDPASNRIFVFDVGTERLVDTLTVPGAWAIDDTPDHSLLWVGTLGGDLYTIDPNALQVTQRYPFATIGPSGFRAISAQVLADGSIGLLGPQGGIPNVDGEDSFAIWNPATNELSAYTQAACGSAFNNMGVFERSADRSELLITGIDGGGLCVVAPDGSAVQYAAAGPYQIAASPDGNLLASSVGGGVQLYDAHTLSLLGQSSGLTNNATGLAFSQDSSTLYVDQDNVVIALALPGLNQVGWMPEANVLWATGGFVSGPGITVLGSTGLIAVPAQEGVNFVDATAMLPGNTGTLFSNDILNPSHGPASGGTEVRWVTENIATAYFGGVEAYTSSSSSYADSYSFAPPGNPGAVDVYGVASDGGMKIVPLGFSYGPALRTVEPNYATSEGGGAGEIYGYGLGAINSTTIPAGVSITIGGQSATITGYNPVAYKLEDYPFPLQELDFTVPPHVSGPADVVVTTPDGSVTLKSGMIYLPAVQQFPAPGANLAQGVYDPKRDVYYFTDSHSILVLSLSLGGWQSPIPIPNSQRVWGIALAPGGSMLAVADYGANVIDTLDPDLPSSVTAHPLPGPSAQGTTTGPAGVAVSDSGMVYFTTDVNGGTGFSEFFKLNTATGAVTGYPVDGPGNGAGDMQLRTLISADDSTVYFGDDGEIFSVDTATDQLHYANANMSCCYGDYDLALSPGQDRVESSSTILDNNLDQTAAYGLDFAESFAAAYVYGVKFSADGALIYQPDPNGIDVMDAYGGDLVARVSLPFSLAQNYDALASDGKDDVFLVVTGNGDGVAAVDLSSIPDPPAPPPNSAASGVSEVSAMRTSAPPRRYAAGRQPGAPRLVAHRVKVFRFK